MKAGEDFEMLQTFLFHSFADDVMMLALGYSFCSSVVDVNQLL